MGMMLAMIAQRIGLVNARRRQSWRRGAALAIVFAVTALASCGATSAARGGDIGPVVRSECVPFARAVAQVAIYGNAADWWSQAAGRYARTRTPEVGSVLVFRRTSRLRFGHVAVVSRVLSDRRILVTHANWVPHRVNADVLAVDVSRGNDWSQVRVWWPPSQRLGASAYPAYGFIQRGRPLHHEEIAANARQFITLATRD